MLNEVLIKVFDGRLYVLCWLFTVNSMVVRNVGTMAGKAVVGGGG